MSKDVKIDNKGLSKCECGALIECDEFGEMPDFCPFCGAVLDYTHIEEDDASD